MTGINGSCASCGTCKHWHQLPADPARLTAPAMGQCRGAPLQVIAIPVAPGTVLFQSHYPQPTADTPACALHVSKE